MDQPAAPAVAPRPRTFRPREYQGRVAAKTWHAPDLLEISLAVEGEPMFEHHPGQYISVVLEGEPRRELRPYSLWSHPSDGTGVATTVVRLVPGGRASTYLGRIEVGSPIRFVAPLGAFFLRDPLPGHLLLVGTGTGVVPLRAMLRELRVRGVADRTVHFYFGARREADLFHMEEFHSLAGQVPGLRFVPTLTRAEAGWTGARGRVTEHLASLPFPAADVQAYLCGNGSMIDDATELLLSRGVDRRAIVREKYFD